MGSDVIRLTGLTASGYHGVLGIEKQTAQRFVVDVDLTTDVRQAASTDDITNTVSYAEIAALAEQIITGESVQLIETLAERIATRILREHPQVQDTTVTVHKPEAPLPQAFTDVAVTIRRTREDLTEEPQRLAAPNPALSHVYEAELIDDDVVSAPTAGSASSPPGVTRTTPTAQLGPYGRMSLADFHAAEAETSRDHLRDPDLPAAFPVTSVLALGSNLGDSRATLASAVQALREHPEVEVVKTSPLARTKPYGGPPNQRDFLNQVVEISTKLSPHALLDLAQRIEADHNRVRNEHWGPRTLDVDIVTYAGAVIDSPRLQVPHPSAAERAFVLLPWSWMDPVALLEGRPVRELAREASDYDDVCRLDDPEQASFGED
ncbi:2-amino-4-hydroxy-6-hydroxymethyldihydropteridine diphosphokinase [Nesterenkonia alba]|uniref:2-amino-4-hydroxy-6- hydroxymethyldihydropteridine diphosphokinase n=1 Tax=Nesterenkonia alba TaxID=515814 RepID=UPI0003B3CF2E|nr:2-amino-4-hydroxy-6-hydroxymethyldihydropteridine diphosphokinase [Nesterenkonia alba]